MQAGLLLSMTILQNKNELSFFNLHNNGVIILSIFGGFYATIYGKKDVETLNSKSDFLLSTCFCRRFSMNHQKLTKLSAENSN